MLKIGNSYWQDVRWTLDHLTGITTTTRGGEPHRAVPPTTLSRYASYAMAACEEKADSLAYADKLLSRIESLRFYRDICFIFAIFGWAAAAWQRWGGM